MYLRCYTEKMGQFELLEPMLYLLKFRFLELFSARACISTLFWLNFTALANLVIN